MKINIKKILTVSLYKTILISGMLTLLITPLLWLSSSGNINWILFANIISFIGTLTLLYPFINYVYPYMITRTGTFLLTSLLTIVSIWLNITTITLSMPYDYIYEATYLDTFEIGGKNKSMKQIKNISNAYLVKDDIESGTGNIIPLWMFGMMY